MDLARRGVEDDEGSERLVLSMRTKISIGGICFLAVMLAVAYVGTPDAAQALRDLGQGPSPNDGNESPASSGDHRVYVLWNVTLPQERRGMVKRFEIDCLMETMDGAILAKGLCEGAEGSNIYLFKVDSEGNLSWVSEIGGRGFDYAQRVIQDERGGLLLLGRRIPWYGESQDELLLKILVDQATGEVSEDSFPVDMGAGSWWLGNMEVLTYSDDRLARLDQDGSMLAEVSLPSAWIFGIREAREEGYFVVWANITIPIPDRLNITLSRLDRNLKEVWKVPLGAGPIYPGVETVHTADDGVLVFACGLEDRTIAKYDFRGMLLWETSYLNGTGACARAIMELADGGFGVLGQGDTAGIPFVFIIRFDQDGNMLWGKTHEVGKPTNVAAGIETGEGGFVLVGGSLVLKLDAWGNKIWELSQ